MRDLDREWAVANRISDRIVELINSELDAMRTTDTVKPLQLFAGQLLALVSTMDTAPPVGQPRTFQDVRAAAIACLDDLIGEDQYGLPSYPR